MKKIVALALALVLLSIPVLATAHTSVFRWQHFGAAPYALSRTKAMQTRERALIKLGLPHQVVALFMEATKKPGKEIRITNGERFSAMISRGGIVHRNVLVDFTAPPISGKMEYAAPAQQWKVTWQGRIYTLVLPKICNNWLVVTSPLVTQNVSQPECASVTFRVKHIGDQVRLAVITDGSRLPSNCWSLSDGGVVSAAPSPCQVCNWRGSLSVLPTGLKVEYSGLYTARGRVQTIRFPREVKGFYIALCVTSAGLGKSDSWIIPPSAWKGTSTIRIPYAKWPVWGRSAITWSTRP